ncbi:MAG: spore coat protein [Clostridiales bacterium]|nr:spore coat protein [Clostridiales bacterium]
MDNYKADITLNEKDSLQDMLNLEKSLVKIYSTAMTEGVSNGFRTLIREHWNEATDDQIKVFFEMTEHGYYEVESAPKESLDEQKEKFKKVKSQLA